MRAEGTGATHPGLKRPANEDAFFVDNELGLYVVCDGMGGHAAGEVASAKAVEVVTRVMATNRDTIEKARQGQVSFAQVESIAESALAEACREVYDLATTDRKLAGMGTTMTLLLIVRDRAIMAHVGDTRLYLLRGGEVHQISSDHTIVAELIRNGSISLEEAKHSPFGHVLNRAIGTHPSVQVDTLVMEVLAGDRFMMCTDGLHDHISDPDKLCDQVPERFEDFPARLVEFANASGGHDNVTAIAIHVDAEKAEAAQAARNTLMVSSKLRTLGSVFLFEDLTLAQLSRVLEVCESPSFDRGHVVIAEGTLCSCMYVVFDGRVGISRRGEPLGELHPGDVVGETTLLAGRPARVTLTALEPINLMLIDGASFRALVQKRPFLGIYLLATLGQRLGLLIDRSHDFVGSCTPKQLEAQGIRPTDLF